MYFSSHLKEDEFFKNSFMSRSCLIISVNIQAYPSHKTKKHVVTYEDFQNSDCELMLLITDVKYVEVYAKSKSVIMNIIENAENCGCSEITIKTDKRGWQNQTQRNVKKRLNGGPLQKSSLRWPSVKREPDADGQRVFEQRRPSAEHDGHDEEQNDI